MDEVGLRTLAMSVAVVAIPIAAGAAIGVSLRRLRGRRFGGVIAALLFVAAPTLAVTALTLRWPVIGPWDALLEGALLGMGVVWTAHRAFVGGREVALGLTALLVSFLLLEAACRLFLPPPPAFAIAGGPNFWLADAMRAGTQNHAWGLRSKEVVCSVVYEEQYPGILDASTERDIVVPRRFQPRPGARRRILHLGDSMTFGFGVARDEAFSALLERLDPETQHINGAIPGVAPDAYLLVLRRWLALHPIDAVIMHVFEGNDVGGLDDRYPCCEWQSLLTYDQTGGVEVHCPTASRVDLGKAGVTWLRYNAPPPYLVRALVGRSHAAAHVAAAIINTMPYHPLPIEAQPGIKLQHLAAVLRSARDELAGRNLPFTVVVLPSRNWVEDQRAEHLAPEIVRISEALQIPVLDASQAMTTAVIDGRSAFLEAPGDPHFSVTGHAVIAAWLHEKLVPTARHVPPDPASVPDLGPHAVSGAGSRDMLLKRARR